MLYIIYSIHKARFELYYTRLYVNYYGYHPYNANNHYYKNQHSHIHHHHEQHHHQHQHHDSQHNYDNLNNFNHRFNHTYNQYHHQYNYSYSNYSNYNNDKYEYNNYHFKISRNKHNIYVIKDDIYNLKVTKHINTNLQFHQKNWSPFEFCPICIYNNDGYIDQNKSYPYSGILLFSYSLQPHRIVKPYKTSISDCRDDDGSRSSSRNNISRSCSRNSSSDHHHHHHYHGHLDHNYILSKNDSHDINEDIHTKHLDYNLISNVNTTIHTHDRLDNHNNSHNQQQQNYHHHHDHDHNYEQQQQQQYEYVDTVYTSKIHMDDDEWIWGEMRGGTPALYINSMDGYLAFFHSSGKITSSFTLTYVMGAYIFHKLPPFHIKYVSNEPILHHTMINETLKWAYKAVDYIIFPMSYIIKNDIIYLSYGKNDLSSWILKLDKNKLFENNLKKVKTHSTISMSYYNNNKSNYYNNVEYIYRNTMHREYLNVSSK